MSGPAYSPQVHAGPPFQVRKYTSGTGVSKPGPSIAAPVTGIVTQVIHEDEMYYEQDFTVASSSWAVHHNFGKSPNVRIIDSSGNTAYPGTTDSSDCNTVYVNWPAPMTGKAICS